MEIVLARHGRPMLSQTRWITPLQLAGWIRAYDEAGGTYSRADEERGKMSYRET